MFVLVLSGHSVANGAFLFGPRRFRDYLKVMRKAIIVLVFVVCVVYDRRLTLRALQYPLCEFDAD